MLAQLRCLLLVVRQLPCHPSKQQECADPFQIHAAVEQQYVFTWAVFGVAGQKYAYELSEMSSVAMAITSHR